MWQQFVMMVLFSAISYAASPRPPKDADALIGELDVPRPPRGQPIPVIFGTGWVKDAGIIYYGNPYSTPIKGEGGK